MVARRPMRAVPVAVLMILSACSSHGSMRVAPSTSQRVTGTTFCALYRRDADNGQLRNWDLNDNAKTASYVETLHALDAVAPTSLRAAVDRILAYYASPNPRVSAAEYEAGLEAGARVLTYVHETCRIDTSASPPGDALAPAP